MGETTTIDAILDFAITEEEKAAAFYDGLSKTMKKAAMREVFAGFAREEMGHRERLLRMKEGKLLVPAREQVQDLKIGDYLVDMEPSPDMEYQEALIVAMKKEKAAFRMYTDLASKVAGEILRNVFLMLAQEEAKHKLRFEVEYDQEIYKEN